MVPSSRPDAGHLLCLYRHVIALQRWASFRSTTQGISPMCVYMSPLSWIALPPSPPSTPQVITEHQTEPLCYRAASHYLCFIHVSVPMGLPWRLSW